MIVQLHQVGTEPSSGQIGFARVRNFDELESVDTNTDGVLDPLSRHALYLFDIKMFTKIGITNLQGAIPINVGDRVDEACQQGFPRYRCRR